MKMAELSNAAHGRWEGILLNLGANAENLKGINKPCPFCGGKDRYSFYDKGVGSWFCRQCGHGDGFDYLSRLRGWSLKETMTQVEAVCSVAPKTTAKAENPAAKVNYMRKIWNEAKPITPGDPAWQYLTNRCGFVPDCVDLRFHAALKHTMGGVYPALVARMLSADGKKAVGLHRTYLDAYGKKAAVDPVKMSLGEMGSIRLAEAETRLGIAEGIETALCASNQFRMPVWAAVCAYGLETWEPVTGIREVWIFGDNDESFTGQAAAYALARKLRQRGLCVQVHIPELTGSDWADMDSSKVA